MTSSVKNTYTLEDLESGKLPPTLSAEQARHILGVGRNTIYEMIHAKKIQTIPVGKTHRVLSASLKKLLLVP